MSDIVVTLPRSFRWDGAPDKSALEAWLAEGDAPGSEPTDAEYTFSVGGGRPRINPGERVYVVHVDRLIGYAPLVRLERAFSHHGGSRWELIRRGGAVAVTIPTEAIPGFRGFRYRWWQREEERPFDVFEFAKQLSERNRPCTSAQK